MGDSIFVAELLGSALAAEQLPGAAVILDIAKAYDTMDRSFLFRIMEAAGYGRPMVQWVQLLLSDTRVYTVVHGHVSMGPKSGKLVSVRAALCLRSSTTL
jgi:hypothetical protein